MKKFLHIPTFNQSGQTLVDLIVALALLSSAVASAGAISTTSNRVNLEGGERAQATALATRELEGIRAYRDTNAMAGTAWSNYMPPAGIPFSGAGCSQFYMKRAGDSWTAVGASGPVGYTSANAGEPGDTAYDNAYSGFQRSIKLCKTATDGVLSVEVLVNWQQGSHSTNVTLHSMLADWSQVQ